MPKPSAMDNYFAALEPHHYRFKPTKQGPTLRLHADDDGRDLGAYIEVEYRKGPEHYLRLRLDEDSRRALTDWFAVEDKKPF